MCHVMFASGAVWIFGLMAWHVCPSCPIWCVCEMCCVRSLPLSFISCVCALLVMVWMRLMCFSMHFLLASCVRSCGALIVLGKLLICVWMGWVMDWAVFGFGVGVWIAFRSVWSC